MNIREALAAQNLTPAPKGETFSRQIILLLQKKKRETKKGAPHAVYFTIPEIHSHLQELGLSATGRYHLQKGGTQDPADRYRILCLEVERI